MRKINFLINIQCFIAECSVYKKCAKNVFRKKSLDALEKDDSPLKVIHIKKSNELTNFVTVFPNNKGKSSKQVTNIPQNIIVTSNECIAWNGYMLKRSDTSDRE